MNALSCSLTARPQELVRSEAAVIEVAQACTQSTGSSVLERLRAAKEDKLRAQAEKQAQGARCAREERAAAAERRLAALVHPPWAYNL